MKFHRLSVACLAIFFSTHIYAVLPYVTLNTQTNPKITFKSKRTQTIIGKEKDIIDDLPAFAQVSRNVQVVNINNEENDNNDNISNIDIMNGILSNFDDDKNQTSYTPLNQVDTKTLQTFVKVIDLVRQEYVQPINDKQLFINAMKGMLKNLDTHAEFLDTQSYTNLQAFAQGDLAETGIECKFDNEQGNWVVQKVIANSPADLAKIKAGYYLHEIDGKKLDDPHINEHDIKQALQGFAGSMVDIVVSDAGRRMHKITLQRTLTKQTSVDVKIDNGIAIIHIPTFQENTRKQILDKLIALQTPVYGVILDVRDNPGGVLTSAVDVAGLFLSKKDAVQIENRQGEIKILKTHSKAYFTRIPVVVLQNRYSASASEVLASALQYHNKATVLGETSYGKGSIQSIIPIDDGQAVKLTVAHYLRPNGAQIDGQGVLPDIDLGSEKHKKFYNNLLNIVGENTFSNSSIPLSDATETRVKLANELQWQKQAEAVLIEQINSKRPFSSKQTLTKYANSNKKPLLNKKAKAILLQYPADKK
ncbi:MAG: S41 family peptidase [Moraxellaceae bacterium]|nr:S41 family peptidase [Moraxellaceae bacterium]